MTLWTKNGVAANSCQKIVLCGLGQFPLIFRKDNLKEKHSWCMSLITIYSMDRFLHPSSRKCNNFTFNKYIVFVLTQHENGLNREQ